MEKEETETMERDCNCGKRKDKRRRKNLGSGPRERWEERIKKEARNYLKSSLNICRIKFKKVKFLRIYWM